MTKPEIMKSFDTPPPADSPKDNYSAEDVTVKQYGDTAIVNFRLVRNTETAGKTETRNYRNTGTFLRRNGKWQVVAWQATPVVEEKPVEEKK